MNDLEEKLYKTLNSLLTNKRMNVLNIDIVKNKFTSNIKIIIDGAKGVTVDDCVEVSQITKNTLQIDNIIDGDFNLEVSSPGINRPLFNIDDYNNHKGMIVKIKLKTPQDNRKHFTGKIIKIIDNSIILDLDGKNFSIDIDNIKKANLLKDIKI
tara:strand:- start:2328 stop:2789 length:462 start_codon:yes stop_codon:yes gene_type:complete